MTNKEPFTTDDQFITTNQVTKMLNVSAETVRRWCRQGKLQAYKVAGDSKQRSRRFRLSDIKKLLTSQ